MTIYLRQQDTNISHNNDPDGFKSCTWTLAELILNITDYSSFAFVTRGSSDTTKACSSVISHHSSPWGKRDALLILHLRSSFWSRKWRVFRCCCVEDSISSVWICCATVSMRHNLATVPGVCLSYCACLLKGRWYRLWITMCAQIDRSLVYLTAVENWFIVLSSFYVKHVVIKF